jgi:hypothetical protein
MLGSEPNEMKLDIEALLREVSLVNGDQERGPTIVAGDRQTRCAENGGSRLRRGRRNRSADGHGQRGGRRFLQEVTPRQSDLTT